jgi:hypothetical protein
LKSTTTRRVSIFFYFVSDPRQLEDSTYDQESWYLRVNHTLTFNSRLRVHASASLQYFIKEVSTYSLRSDPLGRWITFKSTLDERHQEKINDFRDHPRDPKTISFSIMPSIQLTPALHLNFEYGVLGVNYGTLLNHYGLSLNYRWKRIDLALGRSLSTRSLDSGREELSHFESRIQYNF